MLIDSAEGGRDMAEVKPKAAGGRRQPVGKEVAANASPTSNDADGASDTAQRTAMRDHVSDIAQEATLETPAHRIAADRDRLTSTAISCLSAGAAAAVGFSGLGTLMPKVAVSALALGSALLTAVVAILVKNSRAADHIAACQAFDVLQHDAQDFCSVTVMIAPMDQVQRAYESLVSKRDQVLTKAPPVTVRTKNRANNLVTSGRSVKISENVQTLFLNSGEGSRLTRWSNQGPTSTAIPDRSSPVADP
jgi:uncharacterized MnhB-related membrane protein